MRFYNVHVRSVEESSACINTVLSIRNPNKFLVTVSALNFMLYADEVRKDTCIDARTVLDPVYIPAEKEVRVTYTTAVVMSNRLVGLMMLGMPKEEAIGLVVPWWKKIAAGESLFIVEGEATVKSKLGTKSVPFKLQWQQK